MHKTPNRNELPQTVRTENWEPKRGGFAPGTSLQAPEDRRLLHLPRAFQRRIGSLDVAVKKCGELRLGQGPYLLRLLVAVLEKHQRRYAAYAVLFRDLLVLVHVDLGHLELARIFLGDLVEHGGDRLARAAPFGPVVDQ